MYKVRLQVINRRDGGRKYFIYLPRGLIEELGWVKGDELSIEKIIIDVNVKTGKEWLGLVIYREKDSKIMKETQ
jgi:hypothetical protein